MSFMVITEPPPNPISQCPMNESVIHSCAPRFQGDQDLQGAVNMSSNDAVIDAAIDAFADCYLERKAAERVVTKDGQVKIVSSR